MLKGVYHVIMAGGSGTRFWPVSRTSRPKQFLTLAGDLPLIRQAFDRAAAMSGADRVWVAAGVAQRTMVLSALPDLDPARFIGEPCARNTAACVGLSALRLSRMDREALLVMSPADHVYTRPEALRASLAAAVEAARGSDALVTIGIRPTRPETGYGYIEVEGGASPRAARRAARFVEKPDAETARGYVSSGRFLWNSGVFVWRAGSILKAIEACAPDLWRGLAVIDAALGTPQETGATAEVFDGLASISVDYAVLERAPEVLVVASDPGWSDVGSWDAVADLHAARPEGNVVAGAGEAVTIESTRCLVYGEGGAGRVVALVGVEDLVVVDSGDALLVCRKGASQAVRAVVEELRIRGRNDLV